MAEDASHRILQLADVEPRIRQLLAIKGRPGANDAVKGMVDNFIDLAITNSELNLGLRVVLALPRTFSKKLACKTLFLLFWKILDESENLLTRHDFTKEIVDVAERRSAKGNLQAFQKKARQLLSPFKHLIDTYRNELVAHSAHKGERHFLEIDTINVESCLAAGARLLEVSENQISKMSDLASRPELFQAKL